MKKINKRLKKIRDKKELSIKELTKKTGIREEKLTSWENGTSTPNAKELKKLASGLECRIEDLIDSDSLTDDIINHEKDIKIYIIYIIILVVMLGFVTHIVVKNQLKKHEFKTYAFTGESQNYKFERGYVLFSHDMDFIAISNFDLKNNLDIKSISINIAFNETIWASAEYKYNDYVSVDKWLNNLIISEVSQPILGEGDSFIRYDKINFPYDMKIEINYCLKDNSCHIEIIDIKAQELKPDNKLNIRERYYEET